MSFTDQANQSIKKVKLEVEGNLSSNSAKNNVNETSAHQSDNDDAKLKKRKLNFQEDNTSQTSTDDDKEVVFVRKDTVLGNGVVTVKKPKAKKKKKKQFDDLEISDALRKKIVEEQGVSSGVVEKLIKVVFEDSNVMDYLKANLLGMSKQEQIPILPDAEDIAENESQLENVELESDEELKKSEEIFNLEETEHNRELEEVCAIKVNSYISCTKVTEAETDFLPFVDLPLLDGDDEDDFEFRPNIQLDNSTKQVF